MGNHEFSGSVWRRVGDFFFCKEEEEMQALFNVRVYKLYNHICFINKLGLSQSKKVKIH